jgi:asparagine synthase (glutamine-hydrolysing)
MCGIAGLWDVPDVDVATMLARLVHRGPDGRGTATLGDGRTLGHQRLSIVDVDGGAQPFVERAVGAASTRALVANGEIYNAPALRVEVGDKWFTSGSDSEVILHLLRAGVGAVERLHGMFAFALAEGDELFLVRDPLGIKPLYLGTLDEGMVFASELKAFPARSRNVRALPPGSVHSSVSGVRRYWTVPDPPLVPGAGMTLADAATRVREALDSAVVSHLMADVAVGAFLSGGLDSSAICALMRPHVDELHTFTVGLAGSPDLRAARHVAEHLDTVHHELVLTPEDVAAALPKVVVALESFDQDLVRSAVPTWFVARLAAEHVKVVLTGEGADELFAGYDYHKCITEPELLQAETRRSLAELHHVNLQRVDRMTMAHSLEARVPFLDTDVITTALTLPPALRLPTVGGIEKTVLRMAVDDLLPPEIVWRDKAQFDEGSGTADLLPALEEMSAGLDVTSYRARHPDVALRSAEESRYHQLLCAGVARPEIVIPTVARWAERHAA